MVFLTAGNSVQLLLKISFFVCETNFCRRALDPRSAVDFILETLAEVQEPITIVALAPLTNLALVRRAKDIQLTKHLCFFIVDITNERGEHGVLGELTPPAGLLVVVSLICTGNPAKSRLVRGKN